MIDKHSNERDRVREDKKGLIQARYEAQHADEYEAGKLRAVQEAAQAEISAIPDEETNRLVESPDSINLEHKSVKTLSPEDEQKLRKALEKKYIAERMRKLHGMTKKMTRSLARSDGELKRLQGSSEGKGNMRGTIAVLETEATREALRELMPLDTIVTDLWDHDIHFEDFTFADSFFDVALGPEDFAFEQAEVLKEDFVRWAQEYDMDYDQWGANEEEFERQVLAQCRKFIQKWRSNVANSFATLSPDRETD